jgi:malonyl-CoA O-methyltransferase
MAERLAVLRLPPRQVLDWDARLGGGAAALALACPQARIVAVEDAFGMFHAEQALAVRPAVPRAPWWSPRSWRSAGTAPAAPAAPAALAQEAVPPAGADLLWCNMGWHFAPDPAALLQRWLHALEVDGMLMFSTLGPDTLRALRTLYAAQGWPPPMAGFVDMHDIGDLLVQAGFSEPVMDQEVLHLHWPDGRALLAELRSLGGNDHRNRFAGLRTPRWHARLVQALQTLAGPSTDAPGRPGLPFEIVYGHAVKPRPRIPVQAQTSVSVEELRA